MWSEEEEEEVEEGEEDDDDEEEESERVFSMSEMQSAIENAVETTIEKVDSGRCMSCRRLNWQMERDARRCDGIRRQVVPRQCGVGD
jgi:hypothetical protein